MTKKKNETSNPVKETEHTTKRRQQAIETKARIYDCASQLFREKGYDGTSIIDIATAAGLSVGGFYHHFKNKEEIMRIWLTEFDIEYWDYYTKKLCAQEMCNVSPVEKILMMMLYANRLFSSHGYMLSRMTYQLLMVDEPLAKINTNPQRKYFQILRILVGQAQKENRIRPDMDSETIVEDITAISRGCMVDWILSKGENDIIARTTRILSSYLALISL